MICSVVGYTVPEVSKNCQAVQKLFLGCLSFVCTMMVSLSVKMVLGTDKLSQVRMASYLKYNINIYNIIESDTNLYFIRLYSVIIPATRFGPIVGPSSGWSIQLITLSIDEISYYTNWLK